MGPISTVSGAAVVEGRREIIGRIIIDIYMLIL